jgi:hypothetical protein
MKITPRTNLNTSNPTSIIPTTSFSKRVPGRRSAGRLRRCVLQPTDLQIRHDPFP